MPGESTRRDSDGDGLPDDLEEFLGESDPRSRASSVAPEDRGYVEWQVEEAAAKAGPVGTTDWSDGDKLSGGSDPSSGPIDDGLAILDHGVDSGFDTDFGFETDPGFDVDSGAGVDELGWGGWASDASI